MEVLQGHPQSFFVDRRLPRSREKSHHVNQLRRSVVRRDRVSRWLKLGAAGSSRAQFGHSSAMAWNEAEEPRVSSPQIPTAERPGEPRYLARPQSIRSVLQLREARPLWT